MRRDEFTLFATDPRGYNVICSENQLQHIYDHHPELNKFWATQADLKKAIAQAQFIYQSVKGEQYNVYYLSRPGKNIELKVIVKFDEHQVGVLWAAQPSAVGQRKPGEKIIWPQLKP